jgi:DNA polymerase III subunit gamma/tau
MSDSSAPTKPGEYVVVARRYRPQDFEQLVGQKTVSQGLANAITTHRVGHAYLFTGARGVGKTSTARIFAKALNCENGPTTQPCGTCESCIGITAGSDIDVLEIDGASNRGIDEIRELRQNINIRPSRARFKIYIIDEVHMLTAPAFNALLKTLEEPPEHAKFIFCTTEADKIPITVLSRCQRFDFSPMEMGSLLSRLEHILKTENIAYEPEALQIIARRAAGSMRDSQSLLEQLLAFGGDKITEATVHAMLGTANTGRLEAVTQAIVARNAALALQQLHTNVQEGVDVGQFTEQLLGYFRDLAAVTVGCAPELLLHAAPADYAQLQTLGKQFGLETLLAAIQIIDHTLSRMRQSTHSRVLAEVAMIRLCNLADLDQLNTLLHELKQAPAGAVAVRSSQRSLPAPVTTPVTNSNVSMPESPLPQQHSSKEEPVAEKKTEDIVENQVSLPNATAQDHATDLSPLTLAEAQVAWQVAITELVETGEMVADLARLANSVTNASANSAPNTIVVSFPRQYNYQKSACERADRRTRLEQLVSSKAGRSIRLEFVLGAETTPPPDAKPVVQHQTLAQKSQKKREKERHPLVRQVMDMFDAEVEFVAEPPQRKSEENEESPARTSEDV